MLAHPEEGAGDREAALFEGNEWTLSTRLAFRDTEDDLKIFFRILSKNHKNYFPHTHQRLGHICQDTMAHQLSTNCNGLLRVLATCFSNWLSTI
jgi:hypothetical protein